MKKLLVALIFLVCPPLYPQQTHDFRNDAATFPFAEKDYLPGSCQTGQYARLTTTNLMYRCDSPNAWSVGFKAGSTVTGHGVPPASTCTVGHVGDVYSRNDAGAASSTLYVCANTAPATYVWELAGSSGGGGGAPTGAAGGDLGGTYPDPSVVKINGASPAAIATSGSASDLSSGTTPCARQPALTGDATTSAGSCATVTPHPFGATFSNSGSVIAAANSTPIRLPYACTIQAWNIQLSPSGTATFKVWKIASGTAIPTVANSINTAGVAISTGTAVRSTTLSDFTSTTVTADDIAIISLTTVTGSPTSANFQVECK